MENNVIVRRHGIDVTDAYDVISSDLRNLFNGFQGVSFEENIQSQGENNNDLDYLIIYLDSKHQQFLKLEKSVAAYFRLSYHCGAANAQGVNFVYIDPLSKASTVSYNLVRTFYGAAFSILPYVEDSRECISDGYLQCFFTTFEDDEGNTINGFIYCADSSDETGNDKSYLSTENHESLEYFYSSNCFMGSGGDKTVMINALSYTNPCLSRHLFKKLQSEPDKFGVVNINGKIYVSGSHFCLEGKEE